jgi:hypothetical protein
VRGKRKRRIAPKEGLHAKLRRYEVLLKAYGAKIEPSDNGNLSDAETVSEPDDEMDNDADLGNRCHSSHLPFDETKIRLVTKNGSSRYVEKYVFCCSETRGDRWLNSHSGFWSNIRDEVSLTFLRLILHT